MKRRSPARLKPGQRVQAQIKRSRDLCARIASRRPKTSKAIERELARVDRLQALMLHTVRGGNLTGATEAALEEHARAFDGLLDVETDLVRKSLAL